MKCKGKMQLFFWTLLFTITIPLSAHSIGRQIEINQIPSTTFPIVINQPGNYLLTSDLKITTAEKIKNLHGIQINADNVILDLNGHTLTGQGQNGIGIYAFHRNNIQVKNGTVQKFLYGVSLSGSNHEVLEIDAFSNSLAGIKIEYSIITNCMANGNGSYGIFAIGSSLADCSANNNRSCGIYVESSTVSNCKTNHNGTNGIYAEGSLIKNSNVMENKKYGLCLSQDSSGVNNKTRDNIKRKLSSHAPNHLPSKGIKPLKVRNFQDDEASQL